MVALVVAFAFSLLMLKEFFVADWLKKRFLLYASVHMLIMPLLAMTVWSFATKQFFWEIPPWYWLYSLVSFFLAFNWEVSRKIRVPEEEIEGVDSYTRLFGTYGAAYLVLLIRVIDTGLVTLVAMHLGLSVVVLRTAGFVVRGLPGRLLSVSFPDLAGDRSPHGNLCGRLYHRLRFGVGDRAR